MHGAATANASLNTLTDLVLSCSTCGRAVELRWLGRQLHMAASFYSHHHQLAERRPIRAGKKQKPGGMGSATATAITHPFPINCHRLSAYRKPGSLARCMTSWPPAQTHEFEGFFSKLQTRNSISICNSISLPSCIIHARARCRC